MEDSTGTLWISTRRYGLSRFSGGQIFRVSTSHDQTVGVTEDTEGNLWVATNGGGIDRLRAQAFVLLDTSNGLPDDMSTSLCDDATGALWCANRSGGLVRWHRGEAKVFAPPAALGSAYMNVVCVDASGQIWAGASQGLFRLPNQPDATLELVSRELRGGHVLFCARNGDVWLGSGESRLGFFREGTYRSLTAESGYTGRRVRAIAENSRGAIFIANDDRQLFEFVNGRLELRIAKEKMPGGLIYGLHFDSADRLWISTSNGLVLRRGERLQRLTRAQGLPDDLLSQMLEDDRGRLWFGSRRGMFSVELAELVAVADGAQPQMNGITLGRDEGLRGASALNGLQPMAWKARDGRLWFATHKGLVGIDPAASLPPRSPPRIYVDEVLVDRRPLPTTGGLRLGPGVQQVEFRFAAVDYSAPEKVRVRHQLVDYDFGWIEASGERRASYSRLPPGHYTLRVAASHQDGRWGEVGATLAVTVAPAWWQTWWTRGAFALGFTGLVGGLVRYWSHRRLRSRLQRLEHEHALEKERARIARDLHDDLGGSLTQIGMLADRLKRQATEPALMPALSQLAWRTRRLAGDLESIVWTVSPKNNTWDRLALFIGQYVHGFCRETALQGTVTGDDAIPALPLEPDAQHHVLAVLKEALNNVLKHAQATKLAVAVSATNGEFVLRIADDGVGFDPAAAEHAERNGLNNMRSRVADLGGTLQIESRRGAGTVIVLRQRMTGVGPVSRPAGNSN